MALIGLMVMQSNMNYDPFLKHCLNWNLRSICKVSTQKVHSWNFCCSCCIYASLFISESTTTLLTLLKELEPWMITISSLYKVHKSAVLDWNKNPNWLCATQYVYLLNAPTFKFFFRYRNFLNIPHNVCLFLFLNLCFVLAYYHMF